MRGELANHFDFLDAGRQNKRRTMMKDFQKRVVDEQRQLKNQFDETTVQVQITHRGYDGMPAIIENIYENYTDQYIYSPDMLSPSVLEECKAIVKQETGATMTHKYAMTDDIARAYDQACGDNIVSKMVADIFEAIGEIDTSSLGVKPLRMYLMDKGEEVVTNKAEANTVCVVFATAAICNKPSFQVFADYNYPDETHVDVARLGLYEFIETIGEPLAHNECDFDRYWCGWDPIPSDKDIVRHFTAYNEVIPAILYDRKRVQERLIKMMRHHVPMSARVKEVECSR